MANSLNGAHQPGVAHPFKVVTATTTLDPSQLNVIADTTAGVATITLPPAGECTGMLCSVYFVTDGGNLTMDDLEGKVSATFDNAGDYGIYLSNGQYWLKIIEST